MTRLPSGPAAVPEVASHPSDPAAREDPAIAIRRRGFGREDMRPTGPRMNERIRITPIRLIDENGEQAGVVETQDALRRARDLGMDLVEMAADSRPPVCRIMDYGRYKYEQSKKERRTRRSRRSPN